MQHIVIKGWPTHIEKHRLKVCRWTHAFRERRKQGISHPIHDFLFVYYRFSSAKLEEWHPGYGTSLLVTEESPALPHHLTSDAYQVEGNVLSCNLDRLHPKTGRRIKWTVDMLKQTQERRGNYSCFGLHEWAMVYQGQEIRHEKTTKLRLSQSEIDEVVRSRPLTCTHFDAFRFFAESARPMNKIQPTLDDRPQREQPACIHANMDLYKWAFKAMPWIGSELLFDCFLMAIKAREIDMRASPYDLQEYGDYPPIRIETLEGRTEYESLQKEIAAQASPLRAELIRRLETILEVCEAKPKTVSSVTQSLQQEKQT